MTRHRLEVADVFRKYEREFFEQYGSSLSTDQRRAFDAIVACRTNALGGHIEQCDQCGHERNAYNSCRNRHCPKCQAMARAKWTEARAAELLPIPYFHVVFTLEGKEIGPIALQNKKVVYGILFRAAAATLRQLAAQPEHLGAEIGTVAVLHTWGQQLPHHAHVHCICTGGGISPDGTRWVQCKVSNKAKKKFFIPVKVLSLVFRGKFIDFLKRAYRGGELSFHGELAPLKQEYLFEEQLDRAVKRKWVVYAKRPFRGPEQLLKYLARYTHRVAISNNRLIEMRDGHVHFRWKDYRDGGTQKTTWLPATEFIRRFLLHVVPSGFMRIRHSGFLANRFRQQKLELCRQLLGVSSIPGAENAAMMPEEIEEIVNECEEHRRCPVCGKGRMVQVAELPAENDGGKPQDRTTHCPRSPP
jgi:hypothetical protein